MIQRAARVVCDDVAACQTEAGDFAEALSAGEFAWSQALNLADVVTGRSRGRAASDEILIFKSVGLAIEDVAVASRVVDLAREQGVGLELPF
jgi:ornithine cyclodeaminase/alanine dehydrogenase-like protein (mu-crystallin family)